MTCLPGWRKSDSVKDRFFRRVKKGESCWNWIRGYGFGKNGYGIFKNQELKKNVYAHRQSWMIHYGEIPQGKMVLHKCDNRACVNPDHLWLGTSQENTDDMMNKGRYVLPRIRRGENHANAKLSWVVIEQIKKLRKHFVTWSQISKILGFKMGTLSSAYYTGWREI